jgi:hypothetical protein
MSLPSLEDIDATIEAHLQRISAHQDEIVLLQAKISSEREAIARQKQLRNAHLSVNRFPPEVLARIFLFNRPPLWHNHPLRPFLRVTQVCAHWRTSALGHPALWNLVPCRDPATTDWMLARAQSATLVYRGFGHAETKEQGRREAELLQDLSRVRVFDLYRAPEYLLDALKIALESPAPVLENLDFTHIIGHSLAAPDRLFDGQFPELRDVRVHESEFPWQAPYPSQLRSLTLHHITNKISAPDMMLTLRGMNCLERLDLDKAIGSQADSNHTERTVMPRLSCISVEDEELGVLALLQCLEAPALRNLRITTPLRDGASAGQFMTSHLVSSYLDTRSASFKSCVIMQQANVLSMSADRSLPALPFYPYAGMKDSGSDFVLHIGSAKLSGGGIKAKDSVWIGAAVTRSMLAVVKDMSNLSSLTVRVVSRGRPHVQRVLEEELWPALLQTLPAAVTDIHIVDMGQILASLAFTPTALRILSGTLAPAGGSPLPLPAPGLRRLTLVDADLEMSRYLTISNGSLLRACLEARATQDMRIESLELVNCEEDEELADLETGGLVAKVVRRRARAMV